LFLFNPKLHPNNDNCYQVASVNRKIPTSRAIATATLQALFNGVNETEKAAGYESLFSTETSGILKKLNIVSGVAYVNLNADVRTKLSSATSSCGRSSFFAQVEHTLKQFKSVKKVYYAIEDHPKDFFEWMELDTDGCQKLTHQCTSLPFK
jgi:spore germination protein GerM